MNGFFGPVFVVWRLNGNGFRYDVCWLKVLDFFALDFAFDELLYFIQLFNLISADQGDGMALSTCATSPTYAMDVI